MKGQATSVPSTGETVDTMKGSHTQTRVLRMPLKKIVFEKLTQEELKKDSVLQIKRDNEVYNFISETSLLKSPGQQLNESVRILQRKVTNSYPFFGAQEGGRREAFLGCGAVSVAVRKLPGRSTTLEPS